MDKRVKAAFEQKVLEKVASKRLGLTSLLGVSLRLTGGTNKFRGKGLPD